MNKFVGIALLTCIAVIGCDQAQQADSAKTSMSKTKVSSDLVFNVDGLT